ncbi:MAG: dihydroneopterin aldolase [Balneolaceae bacterium]
MNTLTLKSIELYGKHGVHDEEREKGNRFELDVIIHGDFTGAGRNDDLSLTLDYSLIEDVVLKVMSGPSHLLIESLCKKIGDELLKEAPGIQSMELALRKMNPPLKSRTSYAEIRMQWQR